MNDDGTLSEKNAVAIRCGGYGVYFVPNSGRSYTSFQNDLETITGPTTSIFDFYNGGLI